MTSLPPHVPSPIQAAIAGDVEAMMSDWIVPAIYRRGGSGEGALVSVRLTPSSKRSRTIGGRSVQPGNQHAAQTTTILVLADPAGTDAGQGVTDAGKVISLQRGDVFTVAGKAVNRSEPEVSLRVGLEVTLVERSYYTAEVSL